jgi:hypothetical protein
MGIRARARHDCTASLSLDGERRMSRPRFVARDEVVTFEVSSDLIPAHFDLIAPPQASAPRGAAEPPRGVAEPGDS